MADRSLVPLDDNSVYYKSNRLITAKGKTSNIENTITELAICKIQRVSMDSNASLVTTLYANELKQIITSKTNIYSELKKASQRISKRTIMVEDGEGNFAIYPLIQKAEYNRGVFTLRFNEEIRPLITNLSGDEPFTKLRLAVSRDAKSVATAKLYQLFQAELFPTNYKYNKDKGCVIVEYFISDLKFIFGLVDIDHPAIANLRDKMKKEHHYDWDMLYDALPEEEKLYKQSADFIKRLIIPAQKELEELSNIRFEYEPVKTIGKKIGKIRFFVYNNNKNKDRIESSLKQINTILERDNNNIIITKDELTGLYEEFIGFHMLTKDNIDEFLIKANYETERVRTAIYYVHDKGEANDFVGYVMSVIMHPEWDLSGGATVVNGIDVNKELTVKAKGIIRKQEIEQNKNNFLKQALEKENNFSVTSDIDITNQESEKDTLNLQFEQNQSMQKDKSKGSKDIWETVIKKRDDFPVFLQYMADKDNWDLDTFELVFDYPEMVDYWKKWCLSK